MCKTQNVYLIRKRQSNVIIIISSATLFPQEQPKSSREGDNQEKKILFLPIKDHHVLHKNNISAMFSLA